MLRSFFAPFISTFRASFRAAAGARTPEERTFCATWVEEHFEAQYLELAVWSSVCCSALAVFALGFIRYNKFEVAVFHGGIAVFLWTLLTLRGRVSLRVTVPFIYPCIELAMVAFWAWNLHSAIAIGDPVMVRIAPVSVVVAASANLHVCGKTRLPEVQKLLDDLRTRGHAALAEIPDQGRQDRDDRRGAGRLSPCRADDGHPLKIW